MKLINAIIITLLEIIGLLAVVSIMYYAIAFFPMAVVGLIIVLGIIAQIYMNYKDLDSDDDDDTIVPPDAVLA